jgi:predicted metalloprotease with PDZ domain
MQDLPERYRGFLGLCSHEYFHTWNVKRIKPAAFIPYDLQRENYTSLLWAFEGFTSYYDDLALLRSGVIGAQEWLELTAKNIDKVLRGPGRHKQSLAESSFDAWSKFYRPDENTPNAVVSYYTKGALVALALDLTLRAGTDGRTSLDDVMRALWREHGQTGRGVAAEDIRRIAETCSGLRLGGFFRSAVDGTDDLPLARLLRPFGLRLLREAASCTPSLDIKTASEGSELRIATAFSGGAAESAGLAAGDVLLAIDGLRVTTTHLERLLQRKSPGDTVDIHVFRRDELLCVRVQLADPPADTHKFVVTAQENSLRTQWLGQTRL